MIFDDLRVFQAWFGFRNIGKGTQVQDILDDEHDQRVVSKLHEILRPFLLRRMKKDVLVGMPQKREVVIYAGMTPLQREYYQCVQANSLREVLVDLHVEGAKDVSQTNATMNLRKVCNHPFLFGEPRDEHGKFLGEANPKLLVLASGKFRVLDRLLTRLFERKHKVLIFSQMTKLLDIIQDYLEFKGLSYRRLDGSVKMQDRQISIESFNEDSSVFCFLLSTRAGGLGINLVRSVVLLS